ncbi:MmgE/PrpD family protein [Maritimibacter sp. HL-12]|uniref:MmgE/PrpD family protein n=1 Tax=Maritimibacter sp. HL-12 TaxID=1162418 RepID=UPI000A0F13C5|nr:MmgE/PrpD family protein [Maritimibacter sp. HL-12]SMH28837.1 2-methylcitrate dehydratase PrpD [Maritimibacter sp. HL-12]
MSMAGEANLNSVAGDSLSGLLANHVAGLRTSDLPPEVVQAFRRVLVDYLACALAGTGMPVTRALTRWAEAQGARPVATPIGSRTGMSESEAAFVNGAAAHALDFDDGQTRGSVHPGGVVLSAAFAAAEAGKADMSRFIAAVVAGYDVTLRVASAIHPASAGLGWHNTPVAGVFGAAAVASRMRGLDARTTRHALGLAASFAGGLRQYLHDGAEVKRLHPGKAARDGIVCAGLAAEGITGAVECLEGRHGLFHATVEGRADPTQITDRLGQWHPITSAYFKPYPCCRHYHAAIDAVLELRRDHALSSGDVVGVDVGLYEVGARGHDHVSASNLLEVQMSAPCAMAAALIHGQIGVAELDPAAFAAPEPQRLLAATRVFVDPECESAYPGRRSGVVTLVLNDGRRLTRRVLDPRGEGDNPMSDDDLSGKFLANAGPVLGAARAESALAALWAAGPCGDLPALRALLVPA